ncbi:MAG: hypothetical protein M3355_07190 [Actinomycetota bacterium]|nr:hypothetical protein [Actinomycetota bacterium]
MKGERAQASLELLASVPAMVLALVIALQLAITGYTLHLADGAAEAGALAVAAGTDPTQAARAALPGWAAERVDVSTEGGRIEVSVRPPAPLGALSEALEVSASAWARSANGS